MTETEFQGEFLGLPTSGNKMALMKSQITEKSMSIDYIKQRHLSNRYPDYTPDSVYLASNDIAVDLVHKIDKREKVLYQRIVDTDRQTKYVKDYTVYTGYCGLAMLYLLKYMTNNDTEALSRGKKLVSIAVENLKNRGISFLQGDAGPLALRFVFGAYATGDNNPNELSRRLCSLADDVTDSPYELLNGRAGYLYALLFVQKHIENVIPDDLLREQINIILQGGINNAEIKKSNAPLRYEWYETNYLGAAHGVAGILYMLLCCNRLLTENEKNTLIQPTIEWLLSERFPSGNFKSSSGKDKDTLVQWCHGAPGFVHLFTLAGEVFQSQRYTEVALQCGEIVWERGLLSKGYSICHGVSGNAYVFLELYKSTKNLKHLHRAACFADWCTNYPRDENMKPDNPSSLFEGIFGLVYFLNEMKKPLVADFPAYGLH